MKKRNLKLKQRLLSYILLATSTMASFTPLYAQDTPPKLIALHEEVAFDDAKPYISDTHHTMIPYRKLSEALDITIHWESPYVIAEGIHQVSGEMITVRLQADEHTLFINDVAYPITTPSTLIDATTYIPLRLFAETFGYHVTWADGTIHISDPTPELPHLPNKPETPNKPQEPSVPETPNKPQEPSVPETPNTPQEPSVPETPNTPQEPSAPETPNKPQEPSVPETPEVSSFATRVTQLVNKERASQGLQPVTLDAKLSEVAQEKSRDMRVNKYFDHNSPTYGSPFDMMKQFGINYRTAGENIAMGYSTPEAVVEGWMNSPGHRANILKPGFTHMGIGYDANGHYWTQMFVSY